MNYINYIFYKFMALIVQIFGKTELYLNYKKKSKEYKKKRISYQLKILRNNIEFLKAYIKFKQKYNITLPVDICDVGNVFVLDKIKVGDIRREWDNKIYRLNEVSPFKYLQTRDKQIYKNYVKKHEKSYNEYIKKCGIKNAQRIEDVWTSDSMDKLIESIEKEGYLPSKMCICVDENNIILDGQHRSCCILYLYGEDYIIDVCRVKKM